MGYAGVRAGKNLHDNAFYRILFAPTKFYDSTPLGRIINRFSKDQDNIDNTLMDSFRMFLNTFFSTIATFVLIISATPWFVLPLVPVFYLYYYVQNIYRANSRELKRIDSIARSPLFALLGETLTGISTIRAYGEVDRFVSETLLRIETSICPSYLSSSAIRWMSMRFELLGSILLFFAAMFGVIARKSSDFSAAVLGLSLAYALSVTMSINWCARQFTETEVAMNSVERLHYYGSEIEIEAAPIVANNRPDSQWPQQGSIVFENVEMKYLPELPLVLHKISFEIKSQEKIGIVGRTGSGKSSIIQAVFRFIEICGGKISIDGVDVSKIGLKDLRKSIGIIPQVNIIPTSTQRIPSCSLALSERI
jgi:ATP-binding cassette subfamily C (CFTR/MRP) protein 1